MSYYELFLKARKKKDKEIILMPIKGKGRKNKKPSFNFRRQCKLLSDRFIFN